MFRGILKSIKNRKTHYKKLEEADSKLRIAIEKYLNMVFSDNLIKDRVKCEVDVEKSSLIISTSSKAIATEIRLSLGELSRILKEEGLAIHTIVVT
ncbi:MAG: hypothetical protein UT43_C0004G0004 [Parcubacteria group bacterium GW2011_GWC1_39_29]|uniref:DUF721 domain-containing protein n=1 Tax=Candidatus Yanofskybacteria bacterium GW2011_GWD1_39_16 TaxID=1619030 RepID=A0A837HQX6_9BACT|nr:MAG: hypothetical protein UT35_C0001G0004 [Candidatus Yanofskybacteria bacterium GW2011_GWD1_39_16]KKR15245.1 MAG: hypothetical protein UT43_C0004G0004 [Parcubacteria group bacterium GW2011_GWC1_39_29]